MPSARPRTRPSPCPGGSPHPLGTALTGRTGPEAGSPVVAHVGATTSPLRSHARTTRLPSGASAVGGEHDDRREVRVKADDVRPRDVAAGLGNGSIVPEVPDADLPVRPWLDGPHEVDLQRRAVVDPGGLEPGRGRASAPARAGEAEAHRALLLGADDLQPFHSELLPDASEVNDPWCTPAAGVSSTVTGPKPPASAGAPLSSRQPASMPATTDQQRGTGGSLVGGVMVEGRAWRPVASGAVARLTKPAAWRTQGPSTAAQSGVKRQQSPCQEPLATVPHVIRSVLAPDRGRNLRSGDAT